MEDYGVPIAEAARQVGISISGVSKMSKFVNLVPIAFTVCASPGLYKLGEVGAIGFSHSPLYSGRYQQRPASVIFAFLLRRLMGQPFVHAHDLGAPVGVELDVFDHFFPVEHSFERLAFEDDVFPVAAEGRVFADS